MTARLPMALALLTAAALTTPARAADPYTVLGAGVRSCGSWLHDRAEARYWELADQAWVLGYVTSFNEHLSATKNIAAGTNADGLFAWIDNYCRTNPLNSVAQATRVLIDTLRLRRQ
jgi:hypothetical protein